MNGPTRPSAATANVVDRLEAIGAPEDLRDAIVARLVECDLAEHEHVVRKLEMAERDREIEAWKAHAERQTLTITEVTDFYHGKAREAVDIMKAFEGEIRTLNRSAAHAIFGGLIVGAVFGVIVGAIACALIF